MHCIEKLYSDYTEKFLQDISSLYDIDVSPGKRSENIVYDETDLSGITHVVLGEAPGKEEVLAGLPFMGQAGKNLRSNIPEDCVDQTWITNVVKQRPIERTESWGIKNRPPEQKAIDFSVPFLYQELECIGFDTPILIVGKTGTKGLVALIKQYFPDEYEEAKKLLNLPMSQIANTWCQFGPIQAYVIYHTSPFNYSGNRSTKHTASIQDGIAEFYSFSLMSRL